ncbi:MAG: alpha/beta hydrolase, partial [Pseudomonadota bacterium]|nr:alpha/beta hydrolase [Pseudomonadota bacterium]
VSIENFTKIRTRLLVAITALAERGDYVLIGHSLGGVLIRAALQRLPKHVRQPRHVFLLGSPVMPSRLAQTLGGNLVFRAMTGDCGQLLRSPLRMAEIVATTVPTTAIIGIRGLTGKRTPFGDEMNDGVVSLSEVSADWLTDQVQLPVIHTFLPSSSQVADVVLQRLASMARETASP